MTKQVTERELVLAILMEVTQQNVSVSGEKGTRIYHESD